MGNPSSCRQPLTTRCSGRELQFQIDLFELKIEQINFNILGRSVQMIQKAGLVDS